MQHQVETAHAHTASGQYDLFPTFPIENGRIRVGFDALADIIGSAVRKGARHVAIDGFGGVLWSTLQDGLDQALRKIGLEPTWLDTTAYILPESALMERVAPYLGGDDPIFGRLYDGVLSTFLDTARLEIDATVPTETVSIVYGVGASLARPCDLLIYVDVPKDEIQRRMSAKTISNLGASSSADKGSMYKRFYYVDWPVLSRHKAQLLPRVDWFVDGQNAAQPSIIAGDHLQQALREMATNFFRVKPWFAPGPWGGQWMKQHFQGLEQDVPNYAWSFELITPENGLVLESQGERLECSFDLLMFQNYREVLGQAAEQFGYNFPIRFDYLDTFDGGNLSVQCHPRPEYIQKHFGEPFTQDETYYIATCEPGARVYLGFRDGVDPQTFRQEVERSHREGVKIDIERFVHNVDAHPHDLFLIPNGTIHGSGMNNLVLEISATPYIYTFKIYDWMRRDLEGKLRPLNIERAWANLYFERQEAYVHEHLCPKPTLVREGEGWREFFVGTHDMLSYAVHRYEFDRPFSAETNGRCHILNVVEGKAVIVETRGGRRARFNFAETFVIPAAAEGYKLTPVGPCKVVFAYVK